MTRTNGKIARPKSRHTDFSGFLEEQLYPALFDRLPTAFPEFAFDRRGDRYVATNFPADLPYSVNGQHPDRLVCYANTCFGLRIHGHLTMSWLQYVNGGHRLTEPDFLRAVRDLCDRAGVAFPERELTPEEAEHSRRWEARRPAIESVLAICRDTLWAETEPAEQARTYLNGRGFTEADLKDLGVGLYPDVATVRDRLHAAGCDLDAAGDAALLWQKLEGYLVFPWPDASGGTLTLYGRWPGKPPDGRPKTIALPGEGSKGVPLYFDRARREGHKDLVAVEGLLDAALLQGRGDTRVVAYVAASFSQGQIATLARHKVRSVILCPDPDGGGDKGAEASVKRLTAAGIAAYVAPRLPDGLDPDEFVLRDGIDGWRRHVADPTPGAVYLVDRQLGEITPESPEIERRAAADAAVLILRSIPDPRDCAAALALIAERTSYSEADLRPPDPIPFLDRLGCLCVLIEDRIQKLANFTARITRQIERHEQGEVRRQYRIEATHRDGAKAGATIDAKDFESMGWIATQLGAEWALESRRGTKDQARHGIQLLSHRDGIARETVYTSTGWVQHKGQWLYCHAGGAIGPDGPTDAVHVDLGPALAHYRLPDPPEDPDRTRQAIGACLQLLELAQPHRAGSAGVAAILATLPWRAVFGPADFSVHFSGGTGTRKTSAARLGSQHFAIGTKRDDKMPVCWRATPGSLQRFAYDCQDCLLIVDELTGEQAVATATEFIQSQGNLKGRDRMDKHFRVAPSLDPRGSVLSTGEANPTRQSALGRMVTVRFAPETIDLAVLTTAQRNADAGLFAEAMAAFLRWLAQDRLETCRTEQKADAQRITQWVRDHSADCDLHPRHPGVVGELTAAYRQFLSFAAEMGAIPFAAAKEQARLCGQYLLNLVREQGEIQHEASPAQRWLNLFLAGLGAKRFHLIDAHSDAAPDRYADACGWRKDWLFQGKDMGQMLDWCIPANSQQVGYLDLTDGYIYLSPEMAKTIARTMAQAQGEHFENLGSIGRELADAGLLLCQAEGGKKRYDRQKRIRHAGKGRYYFIPIDKVFGSDEGESRENVPDVPTEGIRSGYTFDPP